jgi:hypothetical protein
VSEERPPLTRLRDGALDVVFYAPVGVLTTIGEHMPEFAREGREVVSKRVQLYRMVGQMAVRHGQARLSARFARPAPRERLALERAPAAVDGADVVDAVAAAAEQPGGAEPAPPPPPAEPPPAVPAAIADYDSLAASQVVARLAGLTEGELESVRRYEEHHRGRRTILGKILQLQTAA